MQQPPQGKSQFILVTGATSFEQVKDIVDDRGLSGLVNCAGIAILCPAEHITVGEYRHTVEINLLRDTLANRIVKSYAKQ